MKPLLIYKGNCLATKVIDYLARNLTTVIGFLQSLIEMTLKKFDFLFFYITHEIYRVNEQATQKFIQT